MKKSSLVYLIASATVLFSCNSNKPADQNQATVDTQTVAPADTTPISETGMYMFNYTIGNLPAPVAVLEQYAAAGLPVDASLLNSYKNTSNYQTAVSKALNFGIYGIDLAYLVVNKRSTDLLNYYMAAHKLAQELNMAEIFDQFTQRFENNSSNKDSLMRIIDDVYSNTDRYLRTNERLETASLALAGSWLEAQYITVNLLKNEERTAANDTLYQHVWEQSFHLSNISKIFDELKSNDESKKVKADFNDLLTIYKELKSPADVTKEFTRKLADKLTAVRKKII
jgi:hypothetical protein